MDNRYNRHNRRKYNLKVHIVLVTKYRKQLLKDSIADDVKQKIFDIANAYGYEIIAIETDKDHIHFLLSYDTTDEIVLCTTWRNSYLFQNLCTLLSKSGIKAPVIDKTPEYTGPYPSINFTDCTEQTLQQIPPNVGPNAEILSYILRYQINHWVVLDDAPYQHPLVQTHHVQTNSYFDEINGGLRKTHLPQIQQILEREELHA